MSDRGRAGPDGEIDNRPPERPRVEIKVVRFPGGARRLPRQPVEIEDPDGFDPGPTAA